MRVQYLTPSDPVHIEVDDHYGILLSFSDDEHNSTYAQARVFVNALDKYVERNVEYKDNWRNMGWRGQLIRIRERAERLWDSLWNAHGSEGYTPAEDNAYKLDDAIDLINFCGFLVRAVSEGNRDGNWWNDEHGS
jgi:hypothetical protein